MQDIHHSEAEVRTFILFIQTAQSALRYADKHLYNKVNISVVKLITLQALVSNKGVLTPSEIAEWTQTERHNITTLIKRMEKEGLVNVERNAFDKRSVNIILTDKGREVHRKAMIVAREVVDQVMLSMTDGDFTLLEKILRNMRKNAQYKLKKGTE